MASPARPTRSPYEPSKRTLRENLTAVTKYHMEHAINPSMRSRTIIDSARRTVTSEQWKTLVEAKPIVDAANAVRRMRYSDSLPFDHAVTKLLNLISRTYVENVCTGPVEDTTPAVVFSGPDTVDVIGDYLAACSRPDLTAFMATLEFLKTALEATAKNPFVSRQEFMDLLGIGEWKPNKKLDIKGQLLWYLAALKRYRPDLAIVYGIFIVKDTLRLMSHHACGTTESVSVGLGHVETWVAFVAHLYNIHQSRDDRFAPVPRPELIALWSVQTAPGVSPIFRPFHAGHSPGRVTWLSFEQHPASPERAVGFLKVSWQDTSARFNEPDLLTRAHDGGWLPGLVRHRSAQRVVSDHVSLGDSTRVKEIVHLASLGEPLSQCTSALHLFKVIFDAIGVHENLLGEDIIHRDLSWFNFLCNPWHHPATYGMKPIKKGVPTIETILTTNPSEPCALILDLDHGAVLSELHSADYNPRLKKSGTPMFVAAEMSSRQPLSTVHSTWDLLDRLEAIDKAQELRELRDRTFPGDDGKFMAVFGEVHKKDRARTMSRDLEKVKTDPGTLHHPRHDVESLYWDLLWALLRAAPLPDAPAGSDADSGLRDAAKTLLYHELGEELNRSRFRTDPPVEGLHPLLSKFAPLLRDMGTYLSIPWHLYEGEVTLGLSRNHAHIAFRRMLLAEIHSLSANNAAGDVAFNTKKPRNIRSTLNFGQDRGLKPTRSTGTPYSPVTQSLSGTHDSTLERGSRSRAGDKIVPPRSLPGTATQRGSKRSTATRDVEDQDVAEPPSPKRLRSATKAAAAAKADADAEVDTDAQVDADAQAGAEVSSAEVPRSAGIQPDAAVPYTAEEQPAEAPSNAAAQPDESRDMAALIQAFWDDRILWFGVGDHMAQKTPDEPTDAQGIDPSAVQPDGAPAAVQGPAGGTEDAPQAEGSGHGPAA